MRVSNNKYNSVYLVKQKQEYDDRKNEFLMREKLYYKPHFGPEETDELIEYEVNRRQNQKKYVNEQLLRQIELKSALQASSKFHQILGEIEDVNVHSETHMSEEIAKKEKKKNEL